MDLSKEDLFFDGKAVTKATATTSDVLDFGKHGDDIQHKLFWFVHTSAAGATTIVWQTSDNGQTFTALETKNVTAAANDYCVKNEVLPKGLKRYNRLSITTAADAEVTAGLITGRDEGVPFTGL